MSDKFHIVEHGSRDEWLEQRQKYITASDAHRLLKATDSKLQTLWDEKQAPVRNYSNAYTTWGHEREPVIAAAFSQYLPTVVHNENLCVSNVYEGAAATPDMLDPDTGLSVQIKTTSSDKCADSIEEYLMMHKEYRAQLEWEMLVLGTDMCYLAVEERLGKPGNFTPGPLHVWDYVSSPEIREELLAGLEMWNSFTPKSVEVDDGADYELQHLVYEKAKRSLKVKELKAQLKVLEEEDKTSDVRLLEIMGSDPVRKQFDIGLLEVVAPRKSARFDRAALKKEYPDLEKRFTIESVGKPTIRFKATN